MAETTVTPRHGARHVRALLDLPDVRHLIRELERARWTGRRGYPVRSMVAVALAKSVYGHSTWTQTLRLVGEHKRLRRVVGVVPSEDAMTRFRKKLRERGDLLEDVLDRVVGRLRHALPGYGVDVAIDGSDMPAYANGQRHLYNGGPERTHFSDPHASWGHRSSVGTRKGGGFYGFRLHAAVCARTELPVAWTVRTAKDAEQAEVATLLDIAKRRGIVPATAALDKGYDGQPVHDELVSRRIRPVIALVNTARVLAGEHLPPECGHGTWTFHGADFDRQATTWRCPTAECTPSSVRRPFSRLHPPIPHGTDRWKRIYKGRLAVERFFGRAKDRGGLAPLRVRRLDRVTLHTNLTMLVILGSALVKARALPAVA